LSKVQNDYVQAACNFKWGLVHFRSTFTLNDSAACPCDYSLLHVVYTAFRPLINTPKSNIGFLVCDSRSSVICPIIDAQFTTLV